MPSELALPCTPAGVLPSFRPITRVGVFPAANCLRLLRSADVQGFPVFRVDLAIRSSPDCGRRSSQPSSKGSSRTHESYSVKSGLLVCPGFREIDPTVASMSSQHRYKVSRHGPFSPTLKKLRDVERRISKQLTRALSPYAFKKSWRLVPPRWRRNARSLTPSSRATAGIYGPTAAQLVRLQPTDRVTREQGRRSGCACRSH